MHGTPDPNADDTPASGTQRTDGFLPLASYGALGDGRSVALSGADGAIDWWCVPAIDSLPLFDRLLDADEGGTFALTPEGPFRTTRCYRRDSNVLETTFHTPTGVARLTESLNSGHAGRLPWAELARRLEGIEGSVRFRLHIVFSHQSGSASPYRSTIDRFTVFHVRHVIGLLLHSDTVTCTREDGGITGHVTLRAGERAVVAIVAGEDEPLVVPPIDAIDARIDLSDQAWRNWTAAITYDGPRRDAFVRSALALKLLVYSPSGAIAAAATTSLPEKIGGAKNYDYRYAWVRDAGYTIKAFLAVGAQAEAKAGFTWLLRQYRHHGPAVCYRLDGGLVGDVEERDVPGYRNTGPVVVGNLATRQHQHGIFGDIFGTAWYFVDNGNILDTRSANLLAELADEAADRWRQKDAGIWELPQSEHYTFSKISCWQALARAVELADRGQLPTMCRDRWARERDRIETWINEHCWSEARQAYVMFPGSTALDAAMAMAVRLRFGNDDRMRGTLRAIDAALGAGPFHYRYSGMEAEEGCFIACSFWIAEAWALLGDSDHAERALDALTPSLDRGVGVYTEMIDPRTDDFLGNMPQGLSHLALIALLESLDALRRGIADPPGNGQRQRAGALPPSPATPG
ncbi:glycosyl hydrolase [Ameyamaea chiangmaiensis NBRC 103196]|uniref:Glycoside hydrolase family 15 protein n=1 Tax=Ameyamaea chiangmaiensis TaxID=442969 RepID=A0A850PKX0_9PROT|nr:glycoside hydrolase family 15 protein [Ameyamaea chiangmaiensis]MBS4075223.1 glycoside hydrolase family 15 protein [Ameyamaea chiangmaiensis]NVN41971.1 glycoside hydrolase family 15 protein [Ameyamaea chiangmaiensis]GBQ66455.1 glycosyl hydrolase [Ameyamaea chiangmaiensis NBRC 103196]